MAAVDCSRFFPLPMDWIEMMDETEKGKGQLHFQHGTVHTKTRLLRPCFDITVDTVLCIVRVLVHK